MEETRTNEIFQEYNASDKIHTYDFEMHVLHFCYLCTVFIY